MSRIERAEQSKSAHNKSAQSKSAHSKSARPAWLAHEPAATTPTDNAPGILAWRPITRELLGAALAWGAYLAVLKAPGLGVIPGDLGAFVVAAQPVIFWLAALVSTALLVLASLKSALPALLVMAAAVPLQYVGGTYLSVFAMCASATGFVVCGLGYLGRGRAALDSATA